MMPPPPADLADADADGVVAALARAIEDYLREHPESADTAEHVMHWWLADAVSGATLERTERALRQLARSGVVERVAGGVYRRRRSA